MRSKYWQVDTMANQFSFSTPRSPFSATLCRHKYDHEKQLTRLKIDLYVARRHYPA